MVATTYKNHLGYVEPSGVTTKPIQLRQLTSVGLINCCREHIPN